MLHWVNYSWCICLVTLKSINIHFIEAYSNQIVFEVLHNLPAGWCQLNSSTFPPVIRSYPSNKCTPRLHALNNQTVPTLVVVWTVLTLSKNEGTSLNIQGLARLASHVHPSSITPFSWTWLNAINLFVFSNMTTPATCNTWRLWELQLPQILGYQCFLFQN